jgi:hypothetical protein
MMVDNFMQVMTARRLGRVYHRDLPQKKKFTLVGAREYILERMGKTLTGSVYFGSR